MRIFISYRREDAEGEAGRLFDDLVAAFGEQSVFMDVATIGLGEDFRKVIDNSVAKCRVLLAVIGRNWLQDKDETGKRRLDNPSDFVRLETASALKRSIPVVPVLVHGARMPRLEELPGDLQELAYRNGMEIRGTSWRSDVQVLIKALRSYVEAPTDPVPQPVPVQGGDAPPVQPAREPSPRPTPPPPPTPWWKRPAVVTAWLALIVAIAVVAYIFRPKPTVVVPDLNGIALADATSKLQALNLVVGQKITREDAAKEPDTVLGQSPSAGTAAKSGTAVSLVLSQRPHRVAVPDLIGTSLGDAVAKLQGLNLVVGHRTNKVDKTKDPDTVLSQTPLPGSEVESQTAIDLVLSRRPETAVVVVPAIAGISLDSARQALAHRHLVIGTITHERRSDREPNIVLRVMPAAGSEVASGTGIDLLVSEAVTHPPVQVPDLRGKSLPQAQTQLQNDSLALGTTRKQPRADVTSGTVVGQSPSPGQQVQTGSRVDLTVSEKPTPLAPINLKAHSNPPAIAPEGLAEIIVAATDAAGNAIPDATVTVSASGGAFSGANPNQGTGLTNKSGGYHVYWRAPAAAAAGYVMAVRVTKEGFQVGQDRIMVPVHQVSPTIQCSPTYPNTLANRRVIYIWSPNTSALEAEVYLDGRCQGKIQTRPGAAQSLMFPVPPGKYHVLVRKEGFLDFKKTVEAPASSRPPEQTPKVSIKFNIVPR